MINYIGIIRETKNEWERRTPLIPEDVKQLKTELGVHFLVQPSGLRVYDSEEYLQQGATVNKDLSACEMIFGIKEVKVEDLLAGKIFLFFSHTTKGQAYNMPMLRRIMELKSTLIDYERMIDDQGKRLIYFSYYAGLAGIIDTLWAYGKRLSLAGILTTFTRIRPVLEYFNLDEIKATFRQVTDDIQHLGVLPERMSPCIIGITGYGNVAQGVQYMLDLLPTVSISPAELVEIRQSGKSEKKIYTVVFKENDMVEPREPGQKFDLQDYYVHPEKYRSKFSSYLPHLNILVNTSFWNRQYPKHVTKESIRQLYAADSKPLLQVIGDISCDVEGGIECTLKNSTPGNPVFTYLPETDEARDGFWNHGPLIMAVDNLPSELPLEASAFFSSVLKKLVPDLVRADYSLDFADLDLAPCLKKAIIVYKGDLTPDYRYLQQYL
jgi:saccharopine dehydrogenase (NAD+, L-lysine forming)